MVLATIDCRLHDNTPRQPTYLPKSTWKRAPTNMRYHREVGDPTYLASKEVKTKQGWAEACVSGDDVRCRNGQEGGLCGVGELRDVGSAKRRLRRLEG